MAAHFWICISWRSNAKHHYCTSSPGIPNRRYFVSLFCGYLRRHWNISCQSYLWKAVVLGVLGYATYYIISMAALTGVPKAGIPLVTMGGALWPLTTCILMARYCEHRPISYGEWLGLLVATGGVYFSAGNDLHRSGFAEIGPWVMLSVLGAITWGIFSIWGDRWNLHGPKAIFVFTVITAGISGLWVALSGPSIILKKPGLSTMGLLSGCLLSSSSITFYFAAISHRPTGAQLGLFNLSPFISLGFLALLNGVPLHIENGVGGALVVIGVLIARVWRDPAKSSHLKR